MAASDLETRQRLLQAATELFANRGFDEVTVRQICAAAGANGAAVNYHFRDKAGLYGEVVRVALDTMRETNDLSLRAGDGGTPEEQIRAFVGTFLTRLTGRGRQAWIHKLMARELERPSEVLALVMREIVEPRLDYLATVAGALMGLPPDDPRVRRSVMSLQGQCLVFARRIPGPMAHSWGAATADVAAVAQHISDFSIAGMRALAATTGR